MKPVFVALTPGGVALALRARETLGGEVHVLEGASLGEPFSHGEKVPAPGSGHGPARGQAARADEGVRPGPDGERRSPSPACAAEAASARRRPVAFGDTLSLWERGNSAAPDVIFSDAASHLRGLFEAGRPIVGICAAGILIRVLAPLLADKREEPPVIAMSEDGASVVPLIGGHRGANDLAQRLAEALGGHAAITTAGDSRFGMALDAPPAGWTLANPEDAKAAMAALLAGASARLEGEAPWLRESRIPFAEDGTVRLIATTRRAGPGEAFSQGEKVAAKQPDEGARPGPVGERRSPSPACAAEAASARRRPVAFGDTLSLWERDTAALPPLVYHPRRLAVGVGCERGAEPAEVVELVERTLEDAGLARDAVALVASIDLKADEAAVLQAAEAFGVPARFFTAERLEAETPRLANPSEAVFREVGCHGVAEGAALAAAGAAGSLVVAKRKSARATCAIAEALEVIDTASVGRARGRLAIVGIGPGSADWLTPEAKRLLLTSDAAVGYSLYLDLVVPLIAKAERFDSALGSEEARVRQALSLAAEGRDVALVSSGDAGIYAMAALAFEVLDEERTFSQREKVAAKRPDEGLRRRSKSASAASPHPPTRPKPLRRGEGPSPSATPSPNGRGVGAAAWRIEIVVAPGISAMQAAAARAGAPLGHDFCAISLSDLLTPWEAIERRIRAAAEGDFVVAFYNPVSERRRTQLLEAKRILMEHRPSETPVVLARNLGREGERVTTVTLKELSVDMVDMLTLVLVGASTTRQVEAAGRSFVYTPRGYEKKRGGDAES